MTKSEKDTILAVAFVKMMSENNIKKIVVGEDEFKALADKSIKFSVDVETKTIELTLVSLEDALAELLIRSIIEDNLDDAPDLSELN